MRSLGYRPICTVLVCAGLLLAGCSDDGDTPDDDATGKAKGPASSGKPSGGAIADGVPVAGSFVVTAGEDGDVPVRMAVHAVRRVEGATVLDWSVTPLATAEHALGDTLSVVPNSLGLTTGYGYHALDLVDPTAAKVYRPLISALESPADCTCRPLFKATFRFVIGQTAMLQLAFPELPAELTSIDVSGLGTPTIEDVPVAPIGEVPVSSERVDLAAAQQSPAELGRSAAFDYPQGPDQTPDSRLVAVVEEVRASAERTVLVWRLEAEQPGSGLQDTTVPVTDDALAPVLVRYKGTIASGPGLIPDGSDPASEPVLRASFATMRAKTDKPPGVADDHEWLQCRCSDFQLRDKALTQPGGSLRLVTETGPLPEGTTTVSAVFPGSKVPPIEGLAVQAVEPAAAPEFEKAEVETYDVDPADYPAALTLQDWPTPLPSATSIAATPEVVVDDLRINTTEPNIKAESTPGKVQVTLDTAVFFGPDSAKVRPAAQRAITRIAARISSEAKAGSKVTVVGHVAGTSAGSVAVQQRLSEQRANAVRSGLEAQLGDTDVTLVSEGRGARDPVASNDTEAGRQQNRRVVITYQR